MNKKHKLFVMNYTDISCPKTYQNATQSATKAGYKESNARSIGCKLLKKPTLAQQITSIEEDTAKQYKLTKHKKISMLEQAINEAKVGSQLWVKLLREHGELAGDYITKIESKEEIKHVSPEQSRADMERINRLFKQVNEN